MTEKQSSAGPIAAVLIPAWLIASVFGDELFALIYFGNAEAAFGFSLGKTWWWIYQLIVGIIFGLAALAFSRMRSNETACEGANDTVNDKTGRSK